MLPLQQRVSHRCLQEHAAAAGLDAAAAAAGAAADTAAVKELVMKLQHGLLQAGRLVGMRECRLACLVLEMAAETLLLGALLELVH